MKKNKKRKHSATSANIVNVSCASEVSYPFSQGTFTSNGEKVKESQMKNAIVSSRDTNNSSQSERSKTPQNSMRSLSPRPSEKPANNTTPSDLSSRNLPIWEYRKQIVEYVRQNSVVLITAETGSGKTTQVILYSICDNWLYPN
jgi:HrpA-like RNA helicase